MKSFEQDFYRLLILLKNHVPFAFNRFSDGELFILQNRELVLDDNLIKVGDKIHGGSYTKEDFKRFEPQEHGFYRDRLIDSFKFNKNNYFKGICCRCCTSEQDYEWQFEMLGDRDNENLTWANLWVNGNYPKFINEMYPIFNEYKTVFICNEKADLSAMPFIVKDFRVGYNAMINDYHKIDDIKNWILENNIEEYLFLFSASSFSKMAIHQLYEACDKNTYIDIGTCLNIFMQMRQDRGYLNEYWTGEVGNNDIQKICIW